MKFDSFHFAPPLVENLAQAGFAQPTPIQAQAIPVALKGRDVLGLAQTGTGKTAAFVLPILQKIYSGGPAHGVRALIICPTRELAEQINKVIHQLARHTKIHSVTVYGGVGFQPQIQGVRRGAQIVVACPGRLLDHLRQGTIRLPQVEMVVLDEADRMFDMGFLPDIRSILEKIPGRAQKLLFSATMPPEIRTLAHDILREPETIQIAHTNPVETVSHAIYPVVPHLKGALLVAILKQIDAGSVLVFTRTRHKAKRVADQLAKQEFAAASIQGSMTQSQRQRAMDGFRSGRHRILVATDIAARGIDVSDISHVINFDMPGSVDDYTHRIGRTGRAAKTGDAFTLVTPEDHGMVRQIERALKAPLERKFVEGFDYKAGAPKPPVHAAPGGPGPHRTAHAAQKHGGPAAAPGPSAPSPAAGKPAPSHGRKNHRPFHKRRFKHRRRF